MVGRFDRCRIEQLVVNLLTNALKYGDRKPITLSAFRNQGSVVITLKDEGMGLAAKDQVRVFERFARAVSDKHISGMGLGLYVSKQIVDAHDGRIWVESQLGKGAKFFVELPLRSTGPKAQNLQ